MVTRDQVLSEMCCVTVYEEGSKTAEQILDSMLPLIFACINKHGVLGAMAVLGGADPRAEEPILTADDNAALLDDGTP